jgi:CBS domain-containing protein
MLLSTKAEDFALAPGEPIFYAHRTDKVGVILAALQQRNIMSVPIILKKDQNWRYFGFVDVYDIVKFTLEHFGSGPTAEAGYWEKVLKSEEFYNTEINKIMMWPLSKRNPFHPVKQGYSAWAVLEPLARENIHRIPIVSEDGQIVNLVTQSQVIRVLNDNIAQLDGKLTRPVSSCKRFFKDVIVVQEETTALEAFKLMVESHHGGVAVVNAAGGLVGALSLRDIKAVFADGSKFERLFLSVNKFLQFVKDVGVDDKRPRTVVFATQDDCITKVIRLLAEQKVHRVFITRDGVDRIPIGVVTARDLLLELVDVDSSTEDLQVAAKCG